ncbi:MULTISPECIES: NAD-dependent epimerase/dehydratase family protein [unclassified Nonomuraea]|uniref:NAD-dependent epimerase/dehydratase family protein n=1 Tax=unclassified Nonomuraea TaxID=2593643 RepID=UPI0034038EF6
MQIIGNGFLARNLRPLAAKHPDVVAVASGVSSTATVSDAEFLREATQLYEIVQRCKRARHRMVFFSTASAAMYGPPGDSGREDSPVYPYSPYGRHKLAMEAVLDASGVDYLVLRLSHVVGADQPPHQLLPALVRQIMSGTVRVYRGARRDLVDVADVVSALDGLLSAHVSREVVNVASGLAVPVEYVVEHIEERMGRVAVKDVVEIAGNHSAAPISIEKVRRLAPAALSTRDYRAVLDKYIPAAIGALA